MTVIVYEVLVMYRDFKLRNIVGDGKPACESATLETGGNMSLDMWSL